MYPPGARFEPDSWPVRSSTSLVRAPLCTSWHDEHSIPVVNGGLRRVVFACEPVVKAEGGVDGAVFVFRDPASHHALRFLYRRKDGTLGLVVPE